MAADLTGQNIEDTYPRLLQYYDGSVYDGTGSLVNIAGGSAFPYTGNAVISGSLTITGSGLMVIGNQSITGSQYINGSIYIPDGVNSIYFSGSNAASRLKWNDVDGTLDLGLKGGAVTLQIGQEQVVRVVNKTGADLLESEYKAVRVRLTSEGGAQGQRLAVVLAQATNDANSATTIGIVTETIAVNQEGFITTSGNVRGIDTTGTLQGETWSDGDMLYLSPTAAGGITNIKPQAPDHTVIMGYVVYAHQNNGIIFVKVDNGYEIDELHNVKITTGSLTSGDLLVYSSSVWINTKQLTGSYTLSGSLIATQGITSTLYGTASYANISVTPITTVGSTIYSSNPSTGNVSSVSGLFLGSGAGSGALKADYGIFLGYQAGYSATSASEAVYIGPLAGQNATKADHSVFIGTGAGRDAVSASYSTLIGAYAGWAQSPSIGVGTNNIIIGNYVTLPDGTKNSINIGGIIFATGSYSTLGSAYSGSVMGKIGINKTNPQYNFDVSGSGNYSNGLTVTGSVLAASITGSLQGTATTASYIDGGTF